MQVVTPHDQMLMQCKWCHLVAPKKYHKGPNKQKVSKVPQKEEEEKSTQKYNKQYQKSKKVPKSAENYPKKKY